MKWIEKTEKTAARRKEKEAQIEIVCYMGNNSWFLQTGNQQDSKRSVGFFFLFALLAFCAEPELHNRIEK